MEPHAILPCQPPPRLPRGPAAWDDTAQDTHTAQGTREAGPRVQWSPRPPGSHADSQNTLAR